MDKKDLRIVFMGTPEFAEFTLRRLVEDGYNIIGVVTMPDKPMGRHGSVLQSSPVKKYAVEQGIPVLQPEKLKDPAFIEQLSALKADLQIVVAFRMLPEIVWNMPRLGTFNLHGSLLPQYRGAAPINWAIINGDKETGVTTFFLKHEIDTGDIIYKESIPILPTDNAGTIHDKLMELGASLTVRTLDDIIADRVKPIPQDSIPGLSPYPAAWTVLRSADGREQDFKIYSATPVSVDMTEKPGTIRCDGKRFLEVYTADGAIRLDEVQVAGKKRMPVCSFLCGNDLSDGCFFA